MKAGQVAEADSRQGSHVRVGVRGEAGTRAFDPEPIRIVERSGNKGTGDRWH